MPSTYLITDNAGAVDSTNLHEAEVIWRDIAVSLGKQCIFAGHSSVFFSRAQVAVMVAMQVQPPLRLHALLYEAPAAYLGNIEPHLAPALDKLCEGAGDALQRLWNRTLQTIYLSADIAYPIPMLVENDIVAARRQVIASLRRDLLPDLPKHAENPFAGYPKPMLRQHGALAWPGAADDYYRQVMTAIGMQRSFPKKGMVA